LPQKWIHDVRVQHPLGEIAERNKRIRASFGFIVKML